MKLSKLTISIYATKTYIGKVQPKYLHNDLIKVLRAMKHEKISLTAAVNRYRIPSSTIYNCLSG